MIHPILERELGDVVLRLVHCNDLYYGELIEHGTTIWTSRSEKTAAEVEQRAAAFSDYVRVDLVEIP